MPLLDVLRDPPDRAQAALVALMLQGGAGVLVVNRDGQIVRANDALRRLLSDAVDLSPGAPAASIFAPAERELVWRRLTLVLDGAPPPEDMTVRLCARADDPDQMMLVSATPIPGQDGPRAAPAAAGLLLRLTDASGQRRAESQLAHSQKLQALGTLAGGIAHDFNNLLTAVIGAADMVLSRPAIDAETRADVGQVRASADRGAALVRQLLAFGRQQTLQPRAVPINHAIREMAEMLRRAFGHVRIVVDLQTPGRSAQVDPAQLDQILMNLAVNARDAMQAGGTLTLRSGHEALYRARTVGGETIPPGRYVTIEVSDTGTGIAPDILPRIFEPFFTTRRDQGGSGLGLSTVHGIVRQSGGFLTVESALGKGACFRVYLRRAPDAAEPPPPSLSPTSAPAAPAEQLGASDAASTAKPLPAPSPARALLLVDDEAPVRRLAERALRQRGWDVLAAADGDHALSLLACHLADPDAAPLAALVSDVVMPGLDGPAVVRAVRERCPGLPAILVSGYADAPARAALESGRIDFLAKPYTLRELAEAVERVTSRPPAALEAGDAPHALASAPAG